MSAALEYVDCSSNNGTPDVAAYAAAGHKKLSVKTSEGTGYHWYEGDDAASQAHAHGLVVEFYHWLRPEYSARTQADYFVGWVEKKWRAGDDVMTDYEASTDYATGQRVPDGPDSFRADQLSEFNAHVQQLLARPRVYTGNWYVANKPKLQDAVRPFDVVMSDYSAVTAPPNPYNFHYVAWQYTQTGEAAGFAGPVDLNRILVPTPAPTPVVTPRKAGQMFEIVQDASSKIAYAWAAGYWHRIPSDAELGVVAASPLCINGRDVRAHNGKYRRTPAQIKNLRNFALGK